MADHEYEFESEFNSSYGAVTRRMMRMLSENSRVSISEMSKALGLSRITVRKRMGAMEKEFGIHYTIEFDESVLKLSSQHLIAVKFNSKPDLDAISRLLAKSYIPQLAVHMKGSYDMLIYAASTSRRDYAHWDKTMQILLSDYGVDWRPSEVVHKQLGFFPLRSELVGRTDAPEDYKRIMLMLHGNARMPFRHISKRLGMHFNTVAYNFNKLVESGYIKRFTITARVPKGVSLMSFFSKYRPKAGYEACSAAARKAFMSDDRDSLVSRYLICAPLIGSYDFFTLGAFDSFETAYKRDVMYHRHLFENQGVRLIYGDVESVLLGSLPIRSMDIAREYNKLTWEPSLS